MNKGKVKSFIWLGILIAILIGWFTLRGMMYDFNNSEVAKQIANANLPFHAKIPTKVPFEKMYLWESQSDGKQQIEIDLLNHNKEVIEINITKNKIEYANDLKRQNVIIGESIDGVFIPDDDGNRKLIWQDGGIYYQITCFGKFSPNEVSKRQLIKMAESFE